jgi:8-oxo-dGTP pyrophosphatase MutT (NUDIX family)
LSLLECAKKELEEEAGISSFSDLKSVNAISYAYINKYKHVNNEAEFCFDIKLPVDFVPKNNDGEVDNFYLMNIEEVNIMFLKNIKFNKLKVM